MNRTHSNMIALNCSFLQAAPPKNAKNLAPIARVRSPEPCPKI